MLPGCTAKTSAAVIIDNSLGGPYAASLSYCVSLAQRLGGSGASPKWTDRVLDCQTVCQLEAREYRKLYLPDWIDDVDDNNDNDNIRCCLVMCVPRGPRVRGLKVRLGSDGGEWRNEERGMHLARIPPIRCSSPRCPASFCQLFFLPSASPSCRPARIAAAPLEHLGCAASCSVRDSESRAGEESIAKRSPPGLSPLDNVSILLGARKEWVDG